VAVTEQARTTKREDSETTGGAMLTRQQATEELAKIYNAHSVTVILDEADEYSHYEDETAIVETLTTDSTTDGYLIHWL
jgi:hypothetical protein